MLPRLSILVRRRFVWAAVLFSAASTANAQTAAKFSFQLLTAEPLAVESALTRLAREGYRCAAVARPEAPMMSNSVAVLLGRDLPAAGSVPEDLSVVVGRAFSLDEFERDINIRAANGFTMCGFTWTAPVWGATSGYTPVAVMRRLPGASTQRASYRVRRTQGRSGQWAALEKTAAEGFAVTHLAFRPESPTSDVSDVIFVAEKTAGAVPLEYRLVFSGNAVALEKELAKVPGFGFHSVWHTAGRVSVLLSRPAGSQAPPHDYKVDDPSRLRISGLDGELLKIFRFKEGAIALYDRKRPALDHSIIDGVITDLTRRRTIPTGDERRFIEKLDVDGARGFWPIDFTWRGDIEMGRAVDVILRRPLTP